MTHTSARLPKALRLFLSVDIAGSTAYKSLEPSKVQPWLPALYAFFLEFPANLAAKYQGDVKPPVLWKTLGDEMVFVTQITQHLELAMHLCHFRDTIESYREVITEASRKLDLKGAAWLAGFPVGNTVLEVHRDAESKQIEDYVGPSIDNGFRLSKHATPRKFMLSVEAAYMLLASANPGHTARPEVFLERGEELKGVLGGRPYPKLWIEVHYRETEKFRKLEEELLNPVSGHSATSILEYCMLFIQEYGTPLFVPFIEADPIFGTPPPGYDKQYQEVVDLWDDKKIGRYLKNKPKAPGKSKPLPELEQKIAALASDTKTAATRKKGRKPPHHSK